MAVCNRTSGQSAGQRTFFPGSAWRIFPVLLFSLMALMPVAHAEPPVKQDAAETASYAALADMLENESARNKLIAELRAMAIPSAEPAPEQSVEPPTSDGARTAAEAQTAGIFSRNIAGGIAHFINRIGADLSAAAATLRTLGHDDDEGSLTRQQLFSSLQDFAIVVIATISAFFLLRAVATLIFSRSNEWVMQINQPLSATAATVAGPHRRRQGIYRKTVAIVAAMLVDVIAILLAGVAGYAVGMFTADREAIGTIELLFVNTFVAVEIGKACARAVFAPRYERLRLFSMDDDIAGFWGHWLERLIGLVGYGVLVGVPLIKAMLSPTIGHVFGVFVVMAVYVYAVRIIWVRRSWVRERMERHAGQLSGFFSTLLRILARSWHVLAIAYFTTLLVISQIAPQDALPFMAEASLQTMAALGVGLLLAALANAALARRITLSDSLRSRLPMLEARLNAYVPAILKGVHLLTMVMVVLLVLDAWHAFNLAGWVLSDGGRAVILAVVHVAVILLIAAFVWTTVASIIEHRLSPAPGQGQPSEREKTLLALFRNAALVVIMTLTVLVVLSQIGIDIAPLIAGAGVAGLAIGFGAQKLVQDVITGVFIQLENGMNQNDVVEVAGIFGTVEKITIRSVGIRTLDGGFHMIPFSSVDKVSNHTRDFSYHYGEYTIAYRENVDNAILHLRRAFEELMADSELAAAVLEDISIPGVTSLHERGYNIRVLIKTVPGMQWAVQRAFNGLVKKHFHAAGIELPYPHTVLSFSQDKNGRTQMPPAAELPGWPVAG